jgi:hypothetical protein
MKRIVIKGVDTYGSLLSPYWTKKYLERKGIKVFIYNQEIGLENTFEYELIDDENKLNNPQEIIFPLYLTKNIGNFLLENEWDRLELCDSDEMLSVDEFFYDREDKDLIDITKEINNEKLVKIVEIPDDVKYKI